MARITRGLDISPNTNRRKVRPGQETYCGQMYSFTDEVKNALVKDCGSSMTMSIDTVYGNFEVFVISERRNRPKFVWKC